MASYYAGAGDGTITRTANATWSVVHDAEEGTSFDYTSASSQAMCEKFSTSFYITRFFFPYDTSGIDDEAAISSAVAYYYITAEVGSSIYHNICQTSQDSSDSLATTDYNNWNTTRGCASDYLADDFTLNQYNGFTLNLTGRGWINKTGVTKLAPRTTHDIDNSEPTGLSRITVAMSEDTSGTKDPYLDVTTGYTAADYKDANNVICCRVYQKNE